MNGRTGDGMLYHPPMTPRHLLAALLLAFIGRPAQTANERVDLFADDFSRFAPGVLSAPLGLLNGAIQEYHYIEQRGVRTLPWRNPLVHLDTWAAGDDSEGPYLEQHTINTDARFNPLFVTGDPEWRDYTVEVAVQPLSLEQFAGVAVRYRTSRHYYRVALEDGTHLRLSERLQFDREFRVSAWRPIAEAPFRYDTKTSYRLVVSVDDARIVAAIDGRQLLDVRDKALTAGVAGLTANMPARFRNFRVTATASAAADVRNRIAERDAELRGLRAQNPKPVLWKKFNTPGYGAGRNVRFGDLDGDGRLDMLFAQNVPKVRGDAFDHISCLTAVTLDGKILWQLGRPNPANGLLTNDTPFQIHDLDGDGRTEVVLARDFQLQVLEGKSGTLLRKTWLPPVSRNSRIGPTSSTSEIPFCSSMRTGANIRARFCSRIATRASGCSTRISSSNGRARGTPDTIRSRSTSTATSATNSRSATRCGELTDAAAGVRTRP